MATRHMPQRRSAGGAAPPAPGTERFPVVALVCSSGGLDALISVLEPLPAGFPAAVIAAQHHGAGPRSSLPEILRRRTALQVERAQTGDRLRAGLVLTAPGGTHLIVDAGGRVHLLDAILRPRPSADLLLCTLAASLGPRVTAVVLTGHGSDGAVGVEAVHACGGTVVVQDPASSEVAGMPEAARIADDSAAVLPVEAIAAYLRLSVSDVGAAS